MLGRKGGKNQEKVISHDYPACSSQKKCWECWLFCCNQSLSAWVRSAVDPLKDQCNGIWLGVEWLLYAAGSGGAVDIQAKSGRKEKQTLNTIMMIRKCQKSLKLTL